jgi:hypothetical protein
MVGVIPPLTLNFLRWVIALLLLLPFSYGLFFKTSVFMPLWRRYLALGFNGAHPWPWPPFMLLSFQASLPFVPGALLLNG